MLAMLPICKGMSPKALSEAVAKIKATPDARLSWSSVGSVERDEVLEALIKEQGFLCAYCMRKITLSDAHVEHYVPQSTEGKGDNPLSVDYHNLLAVCDGFAGNAAGQTCDRARGNKPLRVDPLRRETLESIRYRRDGVIYADDETVNRDLDATLNLNQELLRRNRKAALGKLYSTFDRIGKRKGSNAVRSYCQRYVDDHLEHPENRIQYDGIVIYFMRKRIRAAG